MNKFGGWNVNITTNFPQKVATAVADVTGLIGCEYTPIAYIGSQVVNGINHAVLAEQTVLNGKDSKNIVVMVFNEKPNAMEVSLVDIHRIIESGGELGGTNINVSVDLTSGKAKDGVDALNKALEDFVGSDIEPKVFIGTNVTKGLNYIFVGEVRAVSNNSKTEAAIITVNSFQDEYKFMLERVFEPGNNDTLGYAFNW